MIALRKKEALLLFIGDVFFFYFSLWLTLCVRYGEWPSMELLQSHLYPFSLLFVVWVFVFFVSGLYEKHTLLLRNKIPAIILNAQLINSGLAALFFYLIPAFGITPKTNLFICLIISFASVLVWRIYGERFFKVVNPQRAILIGSGAEMKELLQEVNNNPRYDLYFISSIELDRIDSLDFNEEILKRVYSEGVQVIAADLKNDKVLPILPNLYNLMFSHVRFIDMYKIYEDIFDRIPLSLVRYNWFLENISVSQDIIYDIFKRMMDVAISSVLGVLSLVVYPCVYVAIKLDDGGALFSFQERVGHNNQIIKIMKFRTMTIANDSGDWQDKGKSNKITRVGAFLRRARIDELPQLWNVLKGDMSLIGPRPEFPGPVKQYVEQIPYYNIRHIIKPGLSGWAQIYHENHPHHAVAVDATREKLSYDLFYIKNRSLMLDIKIALKTMKALLSRTGI